MLQPSHAHVVVFDHDYRRTLHTTHVNNGFFVFLSSTSRTKYITSLHESSNSLFLLPVLLVVVDETGSRRVMTLNIAFATQLLQDSLGQDLTKLDTHLVVRVDTPDSTLDVDLVLVEGDKGTKGTGSEFLEHDRVGGLVAFKDLGLDEGGVLGLLGAELLSDLLLSLTKGKGSLKRQVVIRFGRQNTME